MKMGRLLSRAFLAAFAAAGFAALPAMAGSAGESRVGSIYRPYVEPSAAELADTPPPPGFAPFYVSHYGRHGSRRLADASLADALAVLEKAAEEDSLTEAGRELAGVLRRVAAVHDGMEGMLTERGAAEHRAIAGRMAARFPEVFHPGGIVRCRATHVPRCIMSMANFSLGLKDAAERLDIALETGETLYRLFTHRTNGDAVPKDEALSACREPVKAIVDADALCARLFRVHAPEERTRFALDLFTCACVCRCLSSELGGLDLCRFFTAEEREAFSRALEILHYGDMGNSEEFGPRRIPATLPLARDIVERADEAIANGRIAADLRFGHDSGLWPLAGRLGLEGAGDRAPLADAWRVCPAGKWMTMAANLQMVFYRNAAGEVLVKFLYNERETRIRGLETVAGVYYRWDDLLSTLQQPNND